MVNEFFKRNLYPLPFNHYPLPINLYPQVFKVAAPLEKLEISIKNANFVIFSEMTKHFINYFAFCHHFAQKCDIMTEKSISQI